MNKNSKINFLQGTLQAGLGLLMLTGTTLAHAQEVEEANKPAASSMAKKSAKKVVVPVYQMKDVSGQVFDAATKKPLAGIRVQALNNRLYTAITNEEGKYTISVPVFVTSLYVAAEEYSPLQLPIKGATGQNISLYKGVLYNIFQDGTKITNRLDVNLEETSTQTVEENIGNSLNGKALVISRGGTPAQGAYLLINGLNSLNANTQPLVEVDGVEWDMQYDRTSLHTGFYNNVFNVIDPEDIESVEVVRNGTAIYGARGANGVLRITTRRGRSLATRITARVYGGVTEVPSLISMMNAGQYRNYMTEYVGTTNFSEFGAVSSHPFLNEDPSYFYYPVYHNDTDWQKDLYRTAYTQNYKVSVEGGDEVAKYNLSVGFVNADSPAKGTDFNRMNVRFNTDIEVFPKLKSRIDIAYTRNAYNLRDNGWEQSYENRNISSPNVLGLLQTPFISPYAYYVRYENGLQLGHANNIYTGVNFLEENNPLRFAARYGFEGLANPYLVLENGDGDNKNSQEQTQFSLTVAPKYEINKYWTVQNRFAYILNRSNERYYLPQSGTPQKFVNGLGAVRSALQSQVAKETTLYNELSARWARMYGAHDVDVQFGNRFSSYVYSYSYLSSFNNSNDNMPNMSYSQQYKGYGGGKDIWRNFGYFVDANYNYQNKYFLNATAMMQTSSRFGSETKGGVKLFGVNWGFFPSLQAGWLISSEDWFKSSAVNYLKLTAGYDISGNDDVDYYSSRTYFSNVKFLDRATALVLTNIENPTIQWETTHRFNLGLQGSFFNNRVTAGLNLFFSKTNDLLTRRTVSDITGLSTMWTNGGALKNSGFDASLNAILVNTSNFVWQAGFSVGHYKNEITELPTSSLNYIRTYALDAAGQKVLSSEKTMHGYTSSLFGQNNILTTIGNPAGVFYGYQTAGVFKTDKEASTAGALGYLRYPTGLAEKPFRNFEAGDVHFVDQNGDGWINEADMVIIGDPNPDFYGNIYTQFAWKNFKLDATFKYSLGNEVYNFQRSQLESGNSFWNQTTALVNRWRHSGQETEIPRIMAATNDAWVNNERFSDRWVEDGSYLKLKNIRLTYKLPLNLSWLQGFSVWGEVNNVFTLTKYLGQDPEVSVSNGILYQGIDAGYLPQSRSYNLGVTFNF